MKFAIFSVSVLLWIAAPGAYGQAPWRSTLYPTDWQPLYRGGSPDDQGRFLHDFSYAGYRLGEVPIPTQVGSTVDVTRPPYSADNTGTQEATSAIQQALDDLADQGGGTVYLPAGTYRLTTGSRDYGLWISRSNVFLKGDGPEKTFLFMDQEDMRKKTMLLASPGTIPEARAWFRGEDAPIALAEDLTQPTRALSLASVDGLDVGDWIVVRTDCTTEWATEHGLADKWGEQTDYLGGIIYYRRITDVDPDTKTIRIDVPTRYWMKRRDNARVYRLAQPHISEVGMSDFSIGQRQKNGTGFETKDYQDPEAAAYAIHGAHAIIFNHVVDGWITNVSTYRPSVNSQNVHLPSNGIQLFQSRNVTVENTHFSYPQYEGGGGNGYAYTHRGSDNLIKDATAVSSRHGFSFKSMWCSGNVIQDGTVEENYLVGDFHMHLSHANLVENFSGHSYEAVYRPYGTVEHGHSGSQNVFWRFTNTDDYQIRSQQWGWGYVVGADAASTPDPVFGDTIQDYQEGTGRGSTLEPQSLYQDQLARRLSSNEGQVDVIVPQADALVRAAPYERENYGTNAYLHVKDGETTYDRQSFLRFDVSNWKEDAAEVTLELSVLSLGNEGVSRRPVELRAVSDTSWNENEIVWDTKPTVGTLLTTREITSEEEGKTVLLDVTGYVNAARRQGGQVSFALVQPTNANAIVSVGSRESSTPPRLRRSGVDRSSATTMASRANQILRSGSDDLRVYQSSPDRLTVVGSHPVFNVSLLTLDGKQASRQATVHQPNQVTVNVSGLRRGIYLVRVVREKKVTVRRILIE